MKGNEFREVERSHVMDGFECQAKELVYNSTDEKPEKVLNGSDTAMK